MKREIPKSDVDAARSKATAAGFKVTQVTGQDAAPLFQLTDAKGNHIATHPSEDGMWRRAFLRRLLPA